VIRRYGNRRLYDAWLSRCVTMDEIASFVRAGEEVRVLDADNGADITRRILVQIILEEQNRNQLDVLPVSLLRSILTARSESVSGWLEQYLAAGADWLERAGKQAASAVIGAPPSGTAAANWPWPFNAMGAAFPVGADASGSAPAAGQAPHGAKTPAAEPRESEADLRRRLEELERTIAGIRGKRR
jgi:polyhydroxyalkanoate synthesis repressor PhaR